MELPKINLVKVGIFALIAVVGIWLFSAFVGFSNTEVTTRNAFKQKMDERTAFYDNMWKTIGQKGQIALKNDSSFARNVDLIMSGRKDAQNLVMKWVQESNPNANFNEVSALYKDLSRTVEAKRDEFFDQEVVIQDIVRTHDNLLDVFPNNLFNFFLNRPHLVYKPITSDRTDDVIKTGKDNNVSVF